MTITITPEIEQALQEEAARQNKTPEQLAIEALIAELKKIVLFRSQWMNWKPRKPLPPGKTLKDVLEELGPWPGDETDEELLAALKAMDD